MCDSILVSPLKMQPYYSQSGRENVTPSSGTSVLASYKKVSHPNLKKKFQCYYEKLLLSKTVQLVTFIVKDYVTCEFFEHQRVHAARLNNIFLKLFYRHPTYCYLQVDLKSFLASGAFFFRPRSH